MRAIILTAGLTLAMTGAAHARQAPEPTFGKDGRATLPSGTMVELLGVTDDVLSVGSWWKPDGKPLVRAPIELSPRVPTTGRDSLIRKLGIAVRVTPPPARTANLKLVTAQFDVGRKTAPLVFSVAEPKRPPGVRLVEFSAPVEAKTATLRLGVETAPGKTETAEFRGVALSRRL